MMCRKAQIPSRRLFGAHWPALLAVALLIPATVHAQTWKVGDIAVQVHGYLSQGYLKSDTNNFLSMNTSEGSGDFTDAGFNVSSQVNRKLRFGAQLYVRNVGEFGNWKPQLDWGYVDYKFSPLVGIRAGKVKTVLGLYNDIQDVNFLHTWALLPLALYPVDLRGETIAHVGGDVYGYVPLQKAGSLAYTAYAGYRPGDLDGGFAYGLKAVSSSTRTSTKVTSYDGHVWGGDLRWNAPVAGLLLGTSLYGQHLHAQGITTSVTNGKQTPYVLETRVDRTVALYSEYQVGGLRLNGEYRWDTKEVTSSLESTAGNSGDPRRWFASAAYRINRWVEAGAYRSVYIRDVTKDYSPATMHIYDTVATVRLDPVRFWNVKIEGHFIDGYGGSKTNLGFYKANNPQGRVAKTNMLVIRTGVNF